MARRRSPRKRNLPAKKAQSLAKLGAAYPPIGLWLLIVADLIPSHGHKTVTLLERFMAQRRPQWDLEGTFERSKLEPGNRHFALWAAPFRKSTRELDFNKQASRRFQVMFEKRLVLLEKSLRNGSKMDCVVLDKPGGVPRFLVEYKKPSSADDDELNLLTHVHQPLNYASQILFKNPEISVLPIILTDGKSFTAGYGKRDSLGELVIVICEAQFSLYRGGRMGVDFDLFWAMCNHASPKCSLDVQVSEDPKFDVRVKRCIGNGVSSFVYEASLVKDPAVKEQGNSLYAKLEAIETLALKITKIKQSNSWIDENKAMQILKERQLQDSCVFPIHRDVSNYHFFIYPLGVPVVPTVSTRQASSHPLEDRHFADLLKDLCAIHRAGIVHRDIRLANIVLMGDRARFIDFGYATAASTVSMDLLGTQVTASQAVLKAALERKHIIYRPEDDLESLLKVFWMHQHDWDIDYAKGRRGIWMVYKAWEKTMKASQTDLSYAAMKAYMEKIFDDTIEPWKVKVLEELAKEEE